MVVGKIMQSPKAVEEEYIFKTKRFTNFVKCILFKLDDRETATEGTQGQVHFVGKFYISGIEKKMIRRRKMVLCWRVTITSITM